MRLTVPHYHQFGEHRPLVGPSLPTPEAWDNVRLQTDTMFAFDTDPADWDRRVTGDRFQERRGRAVVAWLDQLGATDIASYGVGPAPVERWIWRLRPQWRLQLTEYAPGTLKRLRSHFAEAEVHHHDLLEHPPLEAEVHLLCCLDTELDDEQWRSTYRSFAEVPILIYPCSTLGLSTVVNELRQWLAPRPPTRCGYWRTRGRIEELAGETHELHRLSRGNGTGVAWLGHPRR